ncbi:AraC family transcriptional regulator [Aliikangiella sp. G2MR2-5]|uniref:helix-turn-helix domain-containing protein n=1 Tax=Aliikangiella sp. G2MR2-5 TaxID=2788943 RepID=UPI0018A906BA|nr:helix-turn-helix domain-containing protein [Aliikangiella sp. G2MR2-5]
MLFSWFELLLFVGVIQGSVTSFLLFKECHSRVQNRLLGFAILGFAAICVKTAIYSIGLENKYNWLGHIPLAFETAIPPLVYLYCESLTDPKFKLTKTRALHFTPFGLFMLYAVCFYTNVLLVDTNQAKGALSSLYHLSTVKEFEDYFTVVSIAIYLAFGSAALKKYRLQVNNFTSDNSHSVFSWLRNIQILMLVLIVFLVVNMVMDRTVLTQSDSNNHWKIYFLYLAGVIYYLGFKAVKSPIILKRQEKESSRIKEEIDEVKDAKARELVTRIKNIVEENKLHLNPTFSIQELSELVRVNQGTVSQVINRHIGLTFRDFINQQRIEMAKKLLLSNKDKNISILSQAMECGFNSEASFYRVFKKHTGKSPTQYIKASTD